ncbi:putative E3 ubiquitin-protein ligase XBAT35 isoform X1 [Prunus yedoensis var. nudiflora]|uniref:Putative E3 ubiquitin-protein ligase XBAT35 isoform X1 n=1 Tax=Prunus yedoensis var. nudiflora TaxID=2094558 RepID=A0A314YES2_PRUYE|nr:putative E3 ubiquitin-protein ligase XBAT35 isoform X1 [Prunus yedoensis var. nudiflora]
MSQLSVILQETVRREREARTVLEILREQMDDTDGASGGRRTFKQRLRLNGFGCCGAAWVFGRTAAISAQPVNNWDPDCVGPISTGSGMNLAAALAAERQFRAPQESDGGGSVVGPAGNGSAGATAPGTPMRVSLMRLLEETEVDGCDAFGGATTESDKAEGGRGT